MAMLRVFVCVALFVSGCAFEPPERRYQAVNLARPKVSPAPPAKTEVGTEKIPPRICTITVEPIGDEAFCRDHKHCETHREMTCAEAYYRLTHCARVVN